MLRPLFLTAVLAIAAACTTPAQTASAAPASQDCFHSSEVRGFNPIDNHHIRISVGANRQYVLTTNWNAYDLQYAEHIGLRSTTDFICTGNGLGVDIIGGRDHQRYPITSIERAPDPAPQPQHN